MNSEKPPASSPVVRKSIWVGKPSRRSIWLNWAVCLGALGFVALPFVPLDLRGKRNPDQRQAESHARQLGMALFEFESDYGRFPDASTAQYLKDKASLNLAFADRTSNDLFKQLMAVGIVSSEEIFYAKGKGTRKPDGVCNTVDGAIAKGECGFAYVPLGSTDGNPARPLALCPVLPGTHKFDPKPFNGKAVVLRMDNSVQSYQIASDGHIIALGGGDLLDPGHPMWEGKMPEVKWPDLLPVRSESDYALWISIGVIGAVLIILMIVSFGRRRAKHPTEDELGEAV